MRTETVCIKTENEDISRIVRDFLISKGFTIGPYSHRILKEKAPFIWVNYYGALAHADNDRFFTFQYRFDAATQMGEIVKFFNSKPKPPLSIKYEDGTSIFHDGAIRFRDTYYDANSFKELLTKRDAFLKQWADYNKEVK
jgi:hypothetical protein